MLSCFTCRYYGENIRAQSASSSGKHRKRRSPHDVIISTIYDNPAELDPPEPLLRRNEPYHLKHRDLSAPYQAFRRPQDPNLQVLK